MRCGSDVTSDPQLFEVQYIEHPFLFCVPTTIELMLRTVPQVFLHNRLDLLKPAGRFVQGEL